MFDDLIARLEAASEGSGELDALIIAALVEGEAGDVERIDGWIIYKGADRRGNPRLWAPKCEIESEWWRMLADGRGPTRSLDAALALVAEGYGISDFSIWPGEPSRLTLYETRKDRDGVFRHRLQHRYWEATAATAPLAACIAALKARAAIGGRGA